MPQTHGRGARVPFCIPEAPRQADNECVAQGSAGKSGESLDPNRRAALLAIVLDTNVYGHGLPNLRSLQDLAARSARAGLETWIHELIAVEWAEHLAEDVMVLNRQAEKVRKALDRASLNSDVYVAPYPAKNAVVNAVFDAITNIPNVTLVPLTGDAAREGLLDQVLQRGAGRRKSDVKTGASDSAWVRDVITRADGNPTKLLIVTNDRKDVQAVFTALNLDPVPAICSLHELPTAVFHFVADLGYITTMLVRAVAPLAGRSVTDDDHLRGEGLPELAFDIGVVANLNDVVRIDDPWDAEVNATDVVSINAIVAIDEVAIENASQDSDEAGESPRTGSANLWMLVDVDASTHYIDANGELVEGNTTVRDVLVIAQVLFDVVDNAVHNIRGSGAARAVAHSRYDDAFDALGAINEILEITGVDIPDTWYLNNEPFTITVQDVEVHVELAGDETHEFLVQIYAGPFTAAIHCTYDDSAFVGGSREGFYIVPPYQLSSELADGGRYADNGWRSAAMILNAIANH